MSMEGGGLGFATVEDSKFILCSSVVGPNGGVVWAHRRFTDLKKLLPVAACSSSPYVVGFADGVRLLFLWTADGIYTF
ncbi:hypothetical protein C2845_PM03G18570 [Panicum miliaceum]|uniref:Uncharacterized protein n=1 Tax=Panicum miliaceum TaxID=4540 RepID=A0A3L6TB68_PANMI|nr:hypothetical protein C2845_PM03G18570 [Panicum miliaceum]